MSIYHQVSTLLNQPPTTNDLFSPEILLPEQYPPSRTSAYPECGEVALMRAVLEDALCCVQRQAISHKLRDQRLAAEAEAWFFANNDDHVFSFVNICTVLGLDPDYVRLGLKRWRQRFTGTRVAKRRHTVRAQQLLRQAA